MISIQMKDGRVYKTEHIEFVIEANAFCLQFWAEVQSCIKPVIFSRQKVTISVSKVDHLSSSVEESITRLHEAIVNLAIDSYKAGEDAMLEEEEDDRYLHTVQEEIEKNLRPEE